LETELAARPNSAPLLAAYADVLNVLEEFALAGAARFKGCAFGAPEACRQLRLDPVPGGEPTNQSSLGGKCLAEGMESFHADPSRAVEKFTCAIQAVPNSGYANAALALALVRAGDARKAHVPLARACELGHKPSCSRLELISDLQPEQVDTPETAESSRAPTHTLFLRDGRVISGQLSVVGGRYVVQQLDGTEEVPQASVERVAALVPLSALAEKRLPFRTGTLELGLGLGYSASFRSQDRSGSADVTDTVHTVSGAASLGRFLTDTLELEGLLRLAGSLTSSEGVLFVQGQVGPNFHFGPPNNAFWAGPFLGIEVSHLPGAGPNSLETAYGPWVGGQVGLKSRLGESVAIQPGLSLGYAYAVGSEGDGDSRNEHRVRALLEVQLLWQR
jgi:hypothetical protein